MIMAIAHPQSRKQPPRGRLTNKRKSRSPAAKKTAMQLDKSTRDAIIRLAEAYRQDHQRSKRDRWNTPYAEDPLPVNGIGFKDAFDRVWDAAMTDPKRVTLDEHEREEIRTRTESDLKQFVGDYPPEDVDIIARGKEANLFLRECISEGQLVACVRDPETGEILQLQRDGWNDVEFFPGECGWVLYNYVHPDDALNPGPPDAIVRGKARPVFFLRDAFDRWFEKTFGNRSRAGRKPGTGSYAQDDEPLLIRMRSLILQLNAKSVEDAAGQVAKDAKGKNSLESSKQTRLAKRYRDKGWPERN
jgi:hypothetical protein